MMLAVGLFRECWGIKLPSPAAVKRRARQLGYHYARLHFIGGNWWLSLAISECCDLILSLSAELKDCNNTWILAKHGQGPLLIRWHQGRLVQIVQQPLAACTDEFERHSRDTADVKCVRYGWTEDLPTPWADAEEMSLVPRQQRLFPLELVHRLPAYRQQRRLYQLLSAVSLVIVLTVGLWLVMPDAVDPVTEGEAESPAEVLQWLPPTQIIDVLSEQATPRWQGSWEVTRAELRGAKLSLTYAGQTPLAWHSQRVNGMSIASASDAQAPLQGHRSVSLQMQPYRQHTASEAHQLPLLLRELMLAPRPSLKVTQQARRIVLRWQQWSLLQLAELARWLEQRSMRSHSAQFISTAHGWDGEWIMTIGNEERP